ncbi:MAG: tetratricopeptide repeat protein, partial [Mariprofundus sp.]
MKKTLCAIYVAATTLCFSAPVWADNTQHCLQLYYMKSYAQALPFCLLSAEQGNSQSQYVLGLMYADAQGVGEDKAEAIKWFTAASKQGYAAALYKLQKLEDDTSANVVARFKPKRSATNASGAIAY